MSTNKRPVGRPARLTPEQRREVIQLKRSGLSYPKLAKMFGVGIGTIDRAICKTLEEETQ